jgi:hypothetical protein
MMQLSEMNALIAETVKEIDALEAKFIADLDRLPEAIPIEEVEKRMNEMTVAMWSKWARLEAQIKARWPDAQVDEVLQADKLKAAIAEIRDRLAESGFRLN